MAGKMVVDWVSLTAAVMVGTMVVGSVALKDVTTVCMWAVEMDAMLADD
jgi:hypothetical protein